MADGIDLSDLWWLKPNEASRHVTEGGWNQLLSVAVQANEARRRDDMASRKIQLDYRQSLIQQQIDRRKLELLEQGQDVQLQHWKSMAAQQESLNNIRRHQMDMDEKDRPFVEKAVKEINSFKGTQFDNWSIPPEIQNIETIQKLQNLWSARRRADTYWQNHAYGMESIKDFHPIQKAQAQAHLDKFGANDEFHKLVQRLSTESTNQKLKDNQAELIFKARIGEIARQESGYNEQLKALYSQITALEGKKIAPGGYLSGPQADAENKFINDEINKLKNQIEELIKRKESVGKDMINALSPTPPGEPPPPGPWIPWLARILGLPGSESGSSGDAAAPLEFLGPPAPSPKQRDQMIAEAEALIKMKPHLEKQIRATLKSKLNALEKKSGNQGTYKPTTPVVPSMEGYFWSDFGGG